MTAIASRFVILQHVPPAAHIRPAHWDLLIEHGGAFATWWISHWPKRGDTVIATRLPAHRLEYWSLEGAVSASQGEIARVDRGTAEILEQSNDLWRVELLGTTLRGPLELRRNPDANSEQWIMSWGTESSLPSDGRP